MSFLPHLGDKAGASSSSPAKGPKPITDDEHSDSDAEDTDGAAIEEGLLNKLGEEEEETSTEYLEAGFGAVAEWLSACTAAWRKAYRAGHQLVIDETMVYWQGASSAHITYLPRKPTPLGFCMRTLADCQTGILLNAELCDS